MLARCPSPLRVCRDASVIFRDVGPDVTAKATIATSTTLASNGSRTNITTTITSRVATLASSGMPAVIATSCIRATSPTIRCTVSALRLRAWNCWDRPWTCRNTRARNDVAAREPTSAKQMVAR